MRVSFISPTISIDPNERELMKERGKEMNFKEKFRDRGFFFLFFFFQWLYSVSLKKARFRVERKSFDTSNGA